MINKLFLTLFFTLLLIIYYKYHYNKVLEKNSYYYYNSFKYLKIGDIKSSKFYIKKILNSRQKNTIYYDMSILFIYYDFLNKKKDRKLLFLCEKIINNKRLFSNDFKKKCVNKRFQNFN